MKASWRHLPVNLLLLGASLVVGLLLFEFGVRLLAPQNLINNEPIYRYDPHLEKRLIPEAHFEFATPEYRYVVETNALGFRDRYHPVDPPPKTRRILILGDSFTYGPGVAQDRIFPALLEQNLNAGGQQHFEVMAMACGGYGPEHYRAALTHLGLHYDPDIVVLAIYVDNDVTESLDLTPPTHTPQPRGFRHWLYGINNWLEVRSHAFILLRSRLDYPLWKLGLRPYYFPPVFWKEIAPEIERHWQRTFGVLKDIRALCAEHDIRLLAMLIPARYQVHEEIWEKFVDVYEIDTATVDLELPQRKFRAFFERHGMVYVDPLPAFREQGQEELLYFPVDGHWNATGHRLCAQVLAGRLREILGYSPFRAK